MCQSNPERLISGHCTLQEVVACFNAQNDCFSANCVPIKNTPQQLGFQEGAPSQRFIDHKDDNTYILNLASLSSQFWRRKIASVTHAGVTTDQWNSGIQKGMMNWGSKIPHAATSQSSHTASAVASISRN
jgi:hypothetical protein